MLQSFIKAETVYEYPHEISNQGICIAKILTFFLDQSYMIFISVIYKPF